MTHPTSTDDDGRAEQNFYGYFEDAASEMPDYDPPRHGPCPFCGRPITADDVRRHCLMFSSPSYAKRSYFYRTHRSCAETDPTHTAMDHFVLNMIERNGD